MIRLRVIEHETIVGSPAPAAAGLSVLLKIFASCTFSGQQKTAEAYDTLRSKLIDHKLHHSSLDPRLRG
jgi:hypothetical protein